HAQLDSVSRQRKIGIGLADCGRSVEFDARVRRHSAGRTDGAAERSDRSVEGRRLHAVADVPRCHAAVPDAVYLYRDDDPLARRGPRLRHRAHHDERRPRRAHRVAVDDGRAHRVRRFAHGLRECDRVYLGTRVDSVHAVLLPQTECRAPAYGTCVTMTTHASPPVRALHDTDSGIAWRPLVSRCALWSGVFVVMAVICLPGLWVVLNAFRSNVAILSNQSPFAAGSYTLDNF